MRLYLDTCCYCRFFDDTAQAKVRLEAEALNRILGIAAAGRWSIIGSDVLDAELSGHPDGERRHFLRKLIAEVSTEWVGSSTTSIARAAGFIAAGMGGQDANHLAIAVEADADVFLTVDDRLIRKARNLLQGTRVRVLNPCDLVSEDGGHETAR